MTVFVPCMQTQYLFVVLMIAILLLTATHAQPLRGVDMQHTHEVKVSEQQKYDNHRELIMSSRQSQQCVETLRDLGGEDLTVPEFLDYLKTLTPSAPLTLKELPASLLAAYYATACSGHRPCIGRNPSIDLSPTADESVLLQFCSNVNANVKQAISLTFRYLIRYDENLALEELWSKSDADEPSVTSSLSIAARQVLLDYMDCSPAPEAMLQSPLIPRMRDIPLGRLSYTNPFTVVMSVDVQDWSPVDDGASNRRHLASENLQVLQSNRCRFDVDTSVTNIVEFDLEICQELMGGETFDGTCALVVQNAMLTVKESTDVLSREEVGVWRNFMVDSLAEAIDSGAFEDALP